jgi:Fe-S cluster biogenesis protein NfuA
MTDNENTTQNTEDFDQKVSNVLDTIRPLLQRDGGDLELVSIEDDKTVKVRLQGACRGCPGAQMTLKMGVERILREQIPDVKEVVAVQ